MSAETLSSPLRHLELFEGLTPDQLQRIARTAERIVFQPGQPIIRNGEVGEGAVLIVTGIAERTEAPQALKEPEQIEGGALVGEMSMLIDTEHTSTIVARTAVRALRIARSELHRHMVDDPTLADHFVSKISGRLRRLAVELHRIDSTLAGTEADARPH
jgi:CRP-like cAMP-binding protein